MKNFIREKKIYCGNYLEVDIIPRPINEKMPRGKRNKKEKISASKQKNLNDKNAKRYFVQLVNTNFGRGDLHITATYSQDELPKTIDDANSEARNYIRRLDYKRKKEGLSPLKYILVTEFRTGGKNGEEPVRIHHHIIINSGLDRDIVESLWRRRKKKGKEKGKSIGFINADRLQPDEYGLEALCRYLTKNPQGGKRWSSSHNLKKPWSRNNDYRYTKRIIERAARNPDDRSYWERKYPGYYLTECKPVYNIFTGWSIYLKLRR